MIFALGIAFKSDRTRRLSAEVRIRRTQAEHLSR